MERNIRITRLYEYYIETMDASFAEVLPQVIRMYFSYSNTLAGQKKALIYAIVSKNREKDRHTFQSYRPAMEVFTARQIQKGRMNREYAALYRTFLKKPEDPDSAKAIANVLFTHHVTCENPKITRVIVCHPEDTRPFSVRESARIQSFPDDWTFCGGIGDQYKQIGNAVPVEMARRIGIQLKEAVLSEQKG